MNQALLCRWLSVEATKWPPDPCTLLGLPQGASDLAQIEKCVQERMSRLRCYQLSHPEEATEGMNRLAQAFVCLAETAARRQNGLTTPCPPAKSAAVTTAPAAPTVAKETGMNGTAKPPAKPTTKPKVSDDTAVGKKTIVDWKSAPPPVRRPGESGTFEAVTADAAAVSPTTAAPNSTAAEAIPAEAPASSPTSTPLDATAVADDVPTAAPFIPPPCAPVPAGAEEAEQLSHSAAARIGLATVEALIDRIYHTRRVLVAWDRAGAFLGDVERMAAEVPERDVGKRLRALERALEGFPPIIAAPGKPGYRVAAMARLKMTASMLRGSDELHRELLARDWQAGRRILLAYRRFLHAQFKLRRRHGAMRFFGRAVRFFLNDHPALTATGALLVAAASVALYFVLSR
jgi:hypothetical protein